MSGSTAGPFSAVFVTVFVPSIRRNGTLRMGRIGIVPVSLACFWRLWAMRKRFDLTRGFRAANIVHIPTSVGHGAFKSQLGHLASDLGILDSVAFLWLRRDVRDCLQSSWGSVLPSRWVGMSNALLEAMACGG